MKQQKEFQEIYKNGKQYHRPEFVIFYLKNDKEKKFAFIASKKVGNAVLRNKSRRILKAAFLEVCNKVKYGKYIFVAKEQLKQAKYQKIVSDYVRGLKYLQAFLNFQHD